MPDMLVKLYTLPELGPELKRQADAGITIRRAMAYERHQVIGWIREAFSPGWASECDAAFGREPCSCFIAVEAGQIVGFGCHDCTCRNFFGPTGVAESHRKRGIGGALLLACLHAMAASGYAYAIIGGAGPTSFYERAVGATAIPDSSPGIYPPGLHAPR